MAVGASYPAVITNANGDETQGDTITFTDSANQPSGDTVPFQPGVDDTVTIVNDSGGDPVLDFDDDGGQHNFTGKVSVTGDGHFSGDVDIVGELDVGAISSGDEIAATDFAATGLTGAVAGGRYVGFTATVAPTTGTFAVGDVVVSLNGSAWVCTVAGSPGTWVALMANQLTSAGIIASGTLPNTGAWVSGTAKVNPVARDITVNVECVFDGTANAATVVIGVSPDNSTFTTVGTPGVSAAINTVGGLTQVVPVSLPKGWAIKLTIATHASVAASIYY